MQDDPDGPGSVYLDTSLVAVALIADHPLHRLVREFCTDLADRGARVCYSSLLRLELLQAVRVIATDPLALLPVTRRRFRLAHWGDEVAIRERWMRHSLALFDAFLDEFGAVIEVPFQSLAWNLSVDLMCRYHLKSYDAYHAATALGLGVRDFATIDAHFARVSELTVHLIRDLDPSNAST